ncbi:helix-turn-helix domain-containing protein [Weissella cibaria]|uniref:helix-turn-helix domain-containing protein n=1 Tax=Weissella cibaria TaxID=137591 RepID=UPI000E50F738|nr:helix-turn-helix domain-containing protein [Weissella cibaria]MCB5827546.1 helix-turn-helix domain-containing protein [Weissella cibaria]MCB5858065.1 helix-turn-helix domain-containing protein [Weissella cibaria]MCB5860291.1 helix-turn-helix domain-containing protein [Weissella cibaria]MCB5862717.1 helix-turn-helix domain-containing protein [Weissella cibaria]MCB5864808.1 helix-turn-helix domain-containing protein [Weissella cibaria]
MTFYERVYETAKLRGLSIKKLADKIGVSDATIYTWKRTGAPTGKNLTAVSEALGVSIDYLLGNTDDMHQSSNNEMPVDLDEVLSKLGPAVSFGGKELTDEQKLKFYEMAKLMFGE